MNIDKHRVADLLCCALEGGAHHWSRIDFDQSHEPPRPWGGPDLDGFLHLSWPLSKGGSVCIVDEHTNARFQLNERAILQGLEAMRSQEPTAFRRFIEGKENARTGDVFLQSCLFGRVRYG